MKIRLVKNQKLSRPLYAFMDDIPEGLCMKIYSKFQAYVQYGDIYHGNQLKALHSKIWKYKGTIYKLRVDHGEKSARVLFCKSKDGDLTIVHAFLKTTQKTPKKDAKQAIVIYETLDSLDTVVWDEHANFCT